MPTAVAKPDFRSDDAPVRDPDTGQLVTWRAFAACDPGRDAPNEERQAMLARFFIPEFTRPKERDRLEAEAKQICRGCPVMFECLEYALAVGEHEGVWGGLNEVERRAVKRRRAENEGAA